MYVVGRRSMRIQRTEGVQVCDIVDWGKGRKADEREGGAETGV